MGTRCLTLIKDERNNTIINMYRHYDGYPKGHGVDLFEKFGQFKIVNGLQDFEDVANGMEDFAPQVVAHFKKKIGGIYLYAPSTRNVGEEYVYTIYPKRASLANQIELYLKCVHVGFGDEDNKVLYNGLFADFGKYLIGKGE